MSIVVHLRRAHLRSMAVVVASLLGALPAGCATAPESVAVRMPAIGWDGLSAGPAESVAPSSAEWSGWGAASTGASTGAAASTGPATTVQDWGGRSGRSSSGSDRHVTLLVGERWVDEDEWEPLEDQFTLGIELDDHDRSDGNGYEAGLLYADEDADALLLVPGFGVVDASLEVETFEAYGGFRHTFRAGQEGLQPFVSGGLTVLQTEVSADSDAVGSASDDDVTFGAYVRLGLLWEVGERARLGVDVRHVFADDYDLTGVDVDADYDQVLLSLGWAF